MATVSGTLSLPTPDVDKYSLAVVLYSWLPVYGARENTIAQPLSGDTPANLCIRTAFDDPTCNWQMNTRIGKQVLYAVFAEGDPNGTTSDPSDDTYTILGYAVSTGLDLSAGQNLSNQTLTMMSLAETNVAVQFSSAPSGVGERLAFPFIDAGDQGQLVFPLPTLSPASSTAVVPALSGPFAGMSYVLIGLAVPDSEAARPYSATFDRSVTFTGSESMAPFLVLPSALSSNGNVYSFTPPPGASTHFVVLADPSDNPVWTVSILDNTTSFELPTLSPDPRAGLSLEFRVTAADVSGFDPSDFAVKDLAQQMAGVSEAVN